MREYIILMTLICSCSLGAQQAPNRVWYAMNWGSINPSHHGLNEYVEGTLGFRQQWVGFEGAPRTTNATLSFPFNDRKSDGAMFGAGTNVLVERNGAFTFSTATLEGAVNLKTNKENRLSMGMGLGFMQVGYNADYVTTNEQDLVVSRFSTYNYPTFKVGVSYRTKKTLSGVYINDVGPAKWREIGTQASLRTEWGIYYRHVLEFADNWYLIPTLKVTPIATAPFNYEVNVRLNYWNRIQGWLGTQNLNNVQVGIGFKLKEVLAVNYLFDRTRAAIPGVNLNSHAVGIKYMLEKHGAINRMQQVLLD